MLHDITFSYQPPIAGVHTVGIAGDFTDWKIISLDFEKGIYFKSFILTSGIYQYLLIVDSIWINDPSNIQTTPNPFGGVNSLLILDDNTQETSLNELIYSEQISYNITDNFDIPQWVAEGVIY
ncbi:MAG: glycogen-binding domain-containing protein, partial [Candidatus Cloacimonetes bacterium]|nr:glycogen-binding domain-containing protein [Candidatus Cloacimonadota bacterium]